MLHAPYVLPVFVGADKTDEADRDLSFVIESKYAIIPLGYQLVYGSAGRKPSAFAVYSGSG